MSSVDTTEGAALELRQVAGLTAGHTLKLSSGTYQLRDEKTNSDFTIKINSQTGVVMVEPGSAQVKLDDQTLAKAEPLGSAVIDVSSARFVVRGPQGASWNGDDDARDVANPIIEVPTLNPIATGDTSVMDPQARDFMESIRYHREQIALAHRLRYPDPEELATRAANASPALFKRDRNHPLFGVVTVAFADLPWQPIFDRPKQVPSYLHPQIHALSVLPSVPVWTNLHDGPIALVGARNAALACARHITISLAALSPPSDLEIAVLADGDRAADWAWSDSLPHSYFSESNQTQFPVVVADGVHHLRNSGLVDALNEVHGVGVVVLAESSEELPLRCQTVLELAESGTA